MQSMHAGRARAAARRGRTCRPRRHRAASRVRRDRRDSGAIRRAPRPAPRCRRVARQSPHDERIERGRTQVALRGQAIVEEIAHCTRLREMAAGIERQPRAGAGERRRQARLPARRPAAAKQPRYPPPPPHPATHRRRQSSMPARAAPHRHTGNRCQPHDTVDHDAPRRVLHVPSSITHPPASDGSCVRITATGSSAYAPHAEQLVDLVEMVPFVACAQHLPYSALHFDTTRRSARSRG